MNDDLDFAPQSEDSLYAENVTRDDPWWDDAPDAHLDDYAPDGDPYAHDAYEDQWDY